MPRLQYTTARESDLGAGIDQQSAENKLRPGYSEDIENADPKSTGQIEKRKGYQGYAGYVPVRVFSVDYDNNDITLTLDTSIELPLNQSSPIIIQGLTSENSGDFSTETTKYYDGFTAEIKQEFPIGTSNLQLLQANSKVESKFLFVGVAEATDFINLSNSQFIPENIFIDQTTFDVTVNNINNTGKSFEGYIYALDKQQVFGQTYVSEGNLVTFNPGNVTTIPIPNATHNLANNNIIVQVYEESTNLIKIKPTAVRLNDSTGDVEVDLLNDTGVNYNATIILSAAPTANFKTGAVAAGSQETVVIDTSASDATNFTFTACYLELGGNQLEQVIPDSIVTDAANETVTITFTNNQSSGAFY